MHWYRGKEFHVKIKIFFFDVLAVLFLTIFFHCLPISLYPLPPFFVFHSPDLIRYRTRRTRWRRTASALWPTDWFRSKGILCTQISLWRSANPRPGLLRAKERGRWGGRHTDWREKDEEKKSPYEVYKMEIKRSHILDIWKDVNERGVISTSWSLPLFLPLSLFFFGGGGDFSLPLTRTQALSNFFKQPMASHLLPLPMSDFRIERVRTKAWISVADQRWRQT